ncbi:urease accessory UreF family protein [Devosia sp. ZB163]|uniref:urease accessory protein UreF n=1 Tax=Devosia sp. ZB163 TaxID=3025938 RepID=UPI00235FA120|nr:urease accessory UreF family protein [Devosia sp. ZB163]MDC9825868.1 urease accessory UreF family protein [Devosia sp. ZB163]
MTSPAALQKLVTWLSPAFPVGAFAWSAGLEMAIADRRVTDSARLMSWIEGALAHGGIRTDAILLAHAWRAVRETEPAAPPSPTLPARGRVPAGVSGTIAPQTQSGTSPLAGEDGRGEATITALSTLADLSLALVSSRERWMETTITGDSYVRAASLWPAEVLARLPQPCPYPIAVGAIAAAHDIDLEDTLLAWLTATVHGQVSVAIRLVPLGQTDGLRIMSALEPRVAALAKSAASATLADIGAIAYAADIAQMRHETLEPRIFRS